jgi:hypothetical protein
MRKLCFSFRFWLLLCAAAALSACSTPVTPALYIGQQPTLDLQQYFNGTLDAVGMFQDRSGKVVKRFNVVIVASWSGDTGTLDERFSYSDGTRQQRIWTLHKVAADRYIGTAADVVGEAVGVTGGNALQWHYTLALPVDGKVYNVNFDDWMIRVDQRTMLNRAVMSKFGFRLGDVTLSFTKRT